MKKIKYKIIKDVCSFILFFIFFAIIYYYVQLLIILKLPLNSTAALDGFYAIEDNTMDVIFLGSSQMFCTVDGRILAEEYGIESYDFGASSQQLGITYYYFQECLKEQSPKVVMVEACKIFDQDAKFAEGAIAWNYAPMPLSKEQVISANKLFDGDWKKTINYCVLPLFTYHSRWEMLEKYDIEYIFEEDRTYSTRGFLHRETVNKVDILYNTEDEKTYTIPEENVEAILNIVNLAEEENIKVVFFKAPVANWTKTQSDIVKRFMEENNIEYIEMNDYLEELDIDAQTDFHNVAHLNSFGAEKATRFIGEYLLSLEELK